MLFARPLGTGYLSVVACSYDSAGFLVSSWGQAFQPGPIADMHEAWDIKARWKACRHANRSAPHCRIDDPWSPPFVRHSALVSPPGAMVGRNSNAGRVQWIEEATILNLPKSSRVVMTTLSSLPWDAKDFLLSPYGRDDPATAA